MFPQVVQKRLVRRGWIKNKAFDSVFSPQYFYQKLPKSVDVG